jgi:hypothetical protein
MNCRYCNTQLKHVFADLVSAPLSNAMLNAHQLQRAEPYYPLKIWVCHSCYLVQTGKMERDDSIFDENYTYFSSFSSSWLKHCADYVDYIVDYRGLNEDSFVLEIASNDGYLLQNFVSKGIPCIGVEPTSNTAAAAAEKGVQSIVDFFTEKLAKTEFLEKDRQVDLIIGNNVFAHVPDTGDFARGLKNALNENGCINLEFPHLLQLIEQNQFDTIYHEHYSYLSLQFIDRLFSDVGLELFRVEELPTHGGSLRIYAGHQGKHTIDPSVAQVKAREKEAGLSDINGYAGFQEKVDRISQDFMSFLIEQKKAGKNVVGYGAAAKGNTLMNYAGLRGDSLIQYVSDASPHKQGMFLPGSRIEVKNPDYIFETKPDFVVVFPWNLWSEITTQLKGISDWGGQFVRFVPELEIQ